MIFPGSEGCATGGAACGANWVLKAHASLTGTCDNMVFALKFRR